MKKFLFLAIILSNFNSYIIENNTKSLIKQPLGIYMTWQQDLTSTMTIDWHTESEEMSESVFKYRVLGDNSTWMIDTAYQLSFPSSERIIQRIEITGLNAGTEYEFRLGNYERTNSGLCPMITSSLSDLLTGVMYLQENDFAQ